MKKFLKIFVPVAAAAIALGSCAKESKAPAPAETFSISVTANPEADIPASADSKTYIGTLEGVDNSIIWGTGEYMYLYITSGGSTDITKSKDEAADLWNGEAKALFTFDASPAEDTSYLYQGIYPSSAVVESDNTDPTRLKVSLSASQKATAASYDPSAFIMVACPQEFKNIETSWNAYFRKAVALNKWTLTGLANGVISVEITLPEGSALAGRRYIDLSTGESGEVYSSANSVKVSYDTPLSAGEQNIWFTSWGLTLAAGQQLSIVAKTSDKSYTRTITAKEGGIKFQEGALNTIRIDMSSAEQEDVISYAGKYLFASIKDGNWRLMNPEVGSNNYYTALETDIAADAATVDYSAFSEVENIDNYIWSVDESDADYTIKSNYTGKYLSYSGSSNEAYAVSDPSASTLFSISYDSDTKVAEIESKNVAGRMLRFNSGSPRFAFYTSAQTPVYLISAVPDTRTAVTLSFAQAAIELTTANYDGFEGQTAVADPSVEAVTGHLSYSWDQDDSFGLLDENDGTVVLEGIEGQATVTVSFAGDENYKKASASYTINVTDASKLYYVKVTTEPDDWSGEYLIVYEDNNVAWDGSLENLDSTPNTFEVTISGGKIERTDAIEGKQFVIEPMTGGYSILASNGKYIGRETASNGLDASDSELLNTISWDSHPVIAGVGNKTIGFNANSGQEKFRYLGNSNISLYKLNDTRETCAAPVFSEAAGEVEAGTVVTISTATDGADIYYTTNGSNPTADSGIKGTSVTIDANTTLKAIAVKEGYKNSPVASAVYTVAGSGNDGTLQHPYTASEVLGIASTENDVYVAGTIKSITEVSTGYGNATYTITDNTSDALVYRGRFVANTAFTAADQIKVGDEVIICGKIGQHNNVSQLAQGNYIYSLNGITKVLTAPVVTASADDNTKVVTVSWDAVEGASVYDVVCGDKSANNITGTSTTITMDDFGTYNVSVTAKASDAISATGTAVVSLVDESVIHDPVADGTVLFKEGFDGFAADAVPAASNSSTVVYGDAELSYACVNGASTTKIYEENSAGDVSPEILVSKSNGSFTINAIPTGWAEKITLTYFTNNTNLTVSTNTAGVTVGSVESEDKACLVVISTNGEVETFNLTFTNSASGNSRLDLINLVAGELHFLDTPVLTLTKEEDLKQITVSWDAVTGATSYDVTCGEDSQTVTGTSATFTVADYGEYEVSVTAKADNGIPATATSTITLNDPSAVVSKLTYSFTISASDFNTTSYAANNGSHTSTATCTTDNTKTISVSWTSNQVYQNSATMQWQKNTGYIFNTTDLGTIKSVTVNSTAGSFTTYYGSSSHPTSGTTVGNAYFTVQVGGATGKTNSIVVTFEK